MNTRLVTVRTLWALVALEAGFVLPIMSLPSQGDRLPGLPGPLLLLALLPLGFLAVRLIPALRDPSWRLLAAIGAALLARALVASVPGEEDGSLLWLGRNVVPAAIGVGLWWRGGALCVAELTPSEVRGEVLVVVLGSLASLALVRPFVLADQVLLGASVGLVSVGGLLAAVFARQDAADVASGGAPHALGATVALLPVGVAAAAAAWLSPPLLTAMWLTLARIIELLLAPIGWLLAWLGSLLPRGGPAPPPTAPRLPPPNLAPDPAALAELQDRVGWIGTLILIVAVALVALAALLAVNWLLSNWIRPPARVEAVAGPSITAERTGTPRGDARALLAWLRAWLRAQVRRRRRGGPRRVPASQPVAPDAVDAWSMYRRLLDWAAEHGVARRPADTTGEVQARLVRKAPASAGAIDLVTVAFETERYGSRPPTADVLARVRTAVARLTNPRG